MSMPYVVSQVVWNAKAVSETVVLKSELERCKIVVVEVTMAAFSGTVDLQGRISEVSAFSNVPWVRQDQAAAQTPSVSQISETTTTSVVRYVICGWWRQLRIVMTRSAGTITCGVAGSSHAELMPRIVVA